MQSLGIAKPLQTLGIAKLLQKIFMWNQRNFAKPLQSLGIALENAIFLCEIEAVCLFSKPCKNTTAWSFLGMHWNCKSLGFILHPSGLRPLGWNNFPLGICNFNASLPMFMQHYNAMIRYVSCQMYYDVLKSGRTYMVHFQFENDFNGIQ